MTRLSRRDFLRRGGRRPRILELSCERLYMQYADARAEGRLPQFLAALGRNFQRVDEVRLTAREWLERADFRGDLESLLRACAKNVHTEARRPGERTE